MWRGKRMTLEDELRDEGLRHTATSSPSRIGEDVGGSEDGEECVDDDVVESERAHTKARRRQRKEEQKTGWYQRRSLRESRQQIPLGGH